MFQPLMVPQRIQLRRYKGWRMPRYTVKVARPSQWGNPYRVGVHGTASECVEMFRRDCESGAILDYLAENFEVPSQRTGAWEWGLWIGPLVDQNLACWCALDAPCHADVLLELARRRKCQRSHNPAIGA